MHSVSCRGEHSRGGGAHWHSSLAAAQLAEAGRIDPHVAATQLADSGRRPGADLSAAPAATQLAKAGRIAPAAAQLAKWGALFATRPHRLRHWRVVSDHLPVALGTARRGWAGSPSVEFHQRTCPHPKVTEKIPFIRSMFAIMIVSHIASS